jgi:hypothetical protein
MPKLVNSDVKISVSLTDKVIFATTSMEKSSCEYRCSYDSSSNIYTKSQPIDPIKCGDPNL